MSTDTVVEAVRDSLSARAVAATDPHVTVGGRAVLVSCRHPDEGDLAGVAHRPPSDGDVAGIDGSVEHLVQRATDAPPGSVARAVGLATLNALSEPDVEWLVGDPMAALDATVETIATVGLFRPAFRKFGDVSVRVVERDAKRIDPESLPERVPTTLFAPAEADAAFADADVCFITGSTLVYGGIDAYLTAATAAAVPLVVVVGATASLLPTPLFDRGVDLVAGARVRDVDRVRERIAAGDCGTALHDAGLQKVYTAADATLPGLQLPTERPNTDL
ncbi:Rossmann-like domain-containing protein [Salinigranum halophilum]|uniref:Rossmann-like domain-containing protein n=1 Tax=Salinigranum halophilum TaxID=2565931 RepID=UPI0010A75D03|nr:DUF364 domain-containing protein [Salinigranum halophilum]